MGEAGQDQREDAPKADRPAYRVLARKYRPRDFSDLIGQEPMVRTLTNAFATGRIAQAWMLTGVRGVGKTTTARILARALNYRTATEDRPSVELAEPGEHCQAIMDGRHVDVMEMDAASHTGIDDIREIIEQVRYAPVAARYKVYIIDEVHMLSTQAFNGLLKTLEEPPPHVKFIFATTEVRKVPITVLSRCQRFDLRRVEAGALIDNLRMICGREAVEADDGALAMIARASEGSVRDAQSILDQAIAHGGGAVGEDAVREMLGLADRSRVIDLFERVMTGDVAGALGEYRRQYDAGVDPAVLLTDLAEFTHLVTRLRFAPSAASDAALTQDERSRGVEFAGTLSVRVLSRTWQMLLKAIGEVRESPRPVSAGEMALIRIAHAADLPSLDEALKAVEGMAVALPPSSGPASPPRPRGGGGGSAPQRAVAAAPAVSPETVAPPRETEASLATLADIIALADARRDVAFKVMLRRHVKAVRIETGHVAANLTDDAPKTLLADLSDRLGRWTGRRWMASLSPELGGTTLAEEEAARRDSAFVDARADPAVAAVLSRFPGARIIDVRLPEDPDEVTGGARDPSGPEPAPDDIEDDS